MTDPTANFIHGRVYGRGTGREGERWDCSIYTLVPNNRRGYTKKHICTIYEDGDGGDLRIETNRILDTKRFTSAVMEWARSLYPGDDSRLVEPLSSWVKMRIFGMEPAEAFDTYIAKPPPDQPTSGDVFNNRADRFIHSLTLSVGGSLALANSDQAGKTYELHLLHAWALKTIKAWHQEGRLDVDDWPLLDRLGCGSTPLWSVHIDTATIVGGTVSPDYDRGDEIKLVFATFLSVPELNAGAIPEVKVLTLYHRKPTTFYDEGTP